MDSWVSGDQEEDETRPGHKSGRRGNTLNFWLFVIVTGKNGFRAQKKPENLG